MALGADSFCWGASLGGSKGKESACTAGDPGLITGSKKDSLEKGMTALSSILAWRIPWTEEPGGLQSIGSQRVGHEWATFTSLYLFLSSIKFLFISFFRVCWPLSPLRLPPPNLLISGCYSFQFRAVYSLILCVPHCFATSYSIPDLLSFLFSQVSLPLIHSTFWRWVGGFCRKINTRRADGLSLEYRKQDLQLTTGTEFPEEGSYQSIQLPRI